MQVLLSKNGIDYGPLDAETLEGAIDCVSASFTSNEPMSQHLGITLEEFKHFARAAYPPLAEEGLSFVARDQASKRVVGVRISEDLVQEEEPPEIEGLSPKFFPIFSILGQLSAWFLEQRKPAKGQYVHLFMVAVDPHFAGKGIAHNMNRIFFDHVRNLGYTDAMTIPTGNVSQHILMNKFGFKCLKELSYHDFIFEGKKVFQNIQEHKGVMLLERPLADL